MKKIKARVIKGVGGDFWVSAGEKIEIAKARKKLKLGKIKVGDFVEVDLEQKVIERLLPRENELIRPPVANIEQGFIVIGIVPKPDFLLIDKLIIKFNSLKIEPKIVINKMDIATEEFLAEVEANYGKVCEIIEVSAKESKEEAKKTLMSKLEGKLTVLTGQSAVGKTSILKILKPEVEMEVGDLSAKTARGKNTTRHSEVFVLDNGGFIIDTPGFNAFVLDDFTPEQIIDNYFDFRQYSKECKYNNCNHLGEGVNICAVKRAVEQGEICEDRYMRYCQIYKEAKEQESKKYE